MSRRMYHGTVDRFVPSIRKHGLVPDRVHAWHVLLDVGHPLRKVEPVTYVYLTDDERVAIDFAETRIRYYETLPGEKFRMYDQSIEIVKEKDAPVIHGLKPVVLVVDLTEELSNMVENDPRSVGYRLHGKVPPACIHEVRALDGLMEQEPPSFGDMDDFMSLLAASFGPDPSTNPYSSGEVNYPY